MQLGVYTSVKVENPKHAQHKRVGVVVGYDLENDMHLIRLDANDKKPEQVLPIKTVDLQPLG